VAIEEREIVDLQAISARVKLTKSTLGVLARFDVHFTADMECVRCLDSVRREFSGKLQLEYVQGSDPYYRTEKVELRPGEIDRVYYDGRFLDIGVGIRETVIFALPVAPVCRDGCLGLCPACGKNLNKGLCHCRKNKDRIFTLK
jgi:uncharacterized protein